MNVSAAPARARSPHPIHPAREEGRPNENEVPEQRDLSDN